MVEVSVLKLHSLSSIQLMHFLWFHAKQINCSYDVTNGIIDCNKSIKITERSHIRFNILMPWVNTEQMELKCASNGVTPFDTNISVLCGANWLVEEFMWQMKSVWK